MADKKRKKNNDDGDSKEGSELKELMESCETIFKFVKTHHQDTTSMEIVKILNKLHIKTEDFYKKYQNFINFENLKRVYGETFKQFKKRFEDKSNWSRRPNYDDRHWNDYVDLCSLKYCNDYDACLSRDIMRLDGYPEVELCESCLSDLVEENNSSDGEESGEESEGSANRDILFFYNDHKRSCAMKRQEVCDFFNNLDCFVEKNLIYVILSYVGEF